MNNIKYTFLLPAYKAKFFAESLESIKNQTYKEFVCLVSDDCSPEDLKSIYNRVVGDDSRFTFRRNEENMGGKSLVSHWNLLVDMCDTDFLIMASDDDVYESNFLDEIDKLTEKYTEVDLYRGRVKIIDEQSKLLLRDTFYPEYMDHIHFIKKNFANDFITCEACYCYKTEALKNNCKYVNFPSAWFSDDATHIMLAKKGIASTMEYVFSFRQSPINISNTFFNSDDARKKVEASLMFNNWINAYLNQIIESDEKNLKNIARLYCKDKIIRNVQNNLPNCNLSIILRLINRCSKELGISRFLLLYSWCRSHILFNL